MRYVDLIKVVAEKTGVKRAEAKDVIDATLSVICEDLKNGGKVALPAFGTFVTQQLGARKARNPRTGDTIDVPPKVRVKFNSRIEDVWEGKASPSKEESEA